MITRMNQMPKSRRSLSDAWPRVATVLSVVKSQQWLAVQLSGVVELMFTALDTILKGLAPIDSQPKLQPIRIDDQEIRPRTNTTRHDSRK